MQDGADIHHVELGPSAAQRQDGLAHPALQLVALFGVAHLLVVFDVVEHGEVGPIGSVAQAAQLLARARHLNLGVVRGDDGAGLPHATLPSRFGEVHLQPRVELQLGLDRLEHRIRLVDAVHDDDRVALAAGDDAPQDEELRDKRGLGLAARGGDRVGFALVAGDDLGQAREQVVVQARSVRAAHVVRKIGADEVAEIAVRLFAPLLALGGIRVEAGDLGLDPRAEGGGEVGQLGEEGFTGAGGHCGRAPAAPKSGLTVTLCPSTP